LKAYIDIYWNFILSNSHDSISITTSTIDILIELVTFELHGILLKYWRELSSLKITLPNRHFYSLFTGGSPINMDQIK